LPTPERFKCFAQSMEEVVLVEFEQVGPILLFKTPTPTVNTTYTPQRDDRNITN